MVGSGDSCNAKQSIQFHLEIQSNNYTHTKAAIFSRDRCQVDDRLPYTNVCSSKTAEACQHSILERWYFGCVRAPQPLSSLSLIVVLIGSPLTI